jgi:hypothetical protein
MRIFPQFSARWGAVWATWTGTLKPTPLSRTYEVQIRYRLGASPKVDVLSPPLERLSDGTPIPHVYPGNRPCLYLPHSGEWTSCMFIADTIVPWIVLWLYYYEIWRVTGEWLGEGIHPDRKAEEA